MSFDTINTYQKKHNIEDKSLMIHLNASDDRGIDIIRKKRILLII